MLRRLRNGPNRHQDALALSANGKRSSLAVLVDHKNVCADELHGPDHMNEVLQLERAVLSNADVAFHVLTAGSLLLGVEVRLEAQDLREVDLDRY